MLDIFNKRAHTTKILNAASFKLFFGGKQISWTRILVLDNTYISQLEYFLKK